LQIASGNKADISTTGFETVFCMWKSSGMILLQLSSHPTRKICPER